MEVTVPMSIMGMIDCYYSCSWSFHRVRKQRARVFYTETVALYFSMQVMQVQMHYISAGAM